MDRLTDVSGEGTRVGKLTDKVKEMKLGSTEKERDCSVYVPQVSTPFETESLSEVSRFSPYLIWIGSGRISIERMTFRTPGYKDTT